MKTDAPWEAFRDAVVLAAPPPAAIWREGRRRKRRDHTRRTGLLAAAAALAWLAALLLLRPPPPPPAAVAGTDPPTPVLVRVRTPQHADSNRLRVRTGAIDTRLQSIAAKDVWRSLEGFSVAWVGRAGHSPRLYVQPPGSAAFIPVN